MAESKRGGLKIYHNGKWVNVSDYLQVTIDNSGTKALLKELIEEMFDELSKKFVDAVYPVGTIVEFADTTDPNKLYTWTTWEKLEAGYPTITSESGGLAITDGTLPNFKLPLGASGAAGIGTLMDETSFQTYLYSTLGSVAMTSTTRYNMALSEASTASSYTGIALAGTTEDTPTITSGKVISAGIQVVKWRRIK